MAGRGFYDAHSLAQRSAGALGIPLLERAVEGLPGPDELTTPLVMADLGAAGGRNELAPINLAIERLRARGVGPISVVHTDIPSNDFTTLFANLRDNAETYLRAPDVYAFAAGRSFFEQIFPPDSVTLGWCAIAVHWLSSVPMPIDGHVYCSFATGPSRDAFATQSAADWSAFLAARAAELRPRGQIVVVGGAARDDGSSGAEALMGALDTAIRGAVERRLVSPEEYAAMTIPTWNRTLSEFEAPFAGDGVGREVGLALLEHSLAELPDQYLPAFHETSDAEAYARSTTAFLRAFTEPSIFGTLERSVEERAEIADAVYEGVRLTLEADPDAFETRWHVALLRIAKLD
jgi:hypothetical protein